MKKPPKNPDPAVIERFIDSAATAAADTRIKKAPPKGYVRSTFDLPEDLHERLRVASAKTRIPMRVFIEEGLVEHLKSRGLY